jgi:hypothetical protein
VSVTVRTIMPNPIADEDKRIGWIDRPLIGDVVHDEATHFLVTENDNLEVVRDYAEGDEMIAVYPRGHWFGVVRTLDEKEQS